MEWLNYHHLLYFWTVVREGTIAAAAQKLQLAQPTISTQLRSLTQGRAVYSMQFSRYEEVPKTKAEEILSKVRG